MVVPKPAALPFGAITSVYFLQDRAKIRPGERVLVTGASGGVGVYAVQLAKHLGAHVTGVCSTANLELVRSLGADHVLDYTTADPRESGRIYDVIIDAVSATSYAGYRSSLSPRGRHVFIEGGLRELGQSVVTSLLRGPSVVCGVAEDSRESLRRVLALVESGAIRPIVGHRFRMGEIVEAHRVVERRRRCGAVVVAFGRATEAA